MWEAIGRWFLDHYPDLASVIIIAFIIGYVGYRIIRFNYKRVVPLENDNTSFKGNIREIKEGIAEIKDKFSSDLYSLKTNLNIVLSYLAIRDQSEYLKDLLRSQSPRHLTDIGLKILTECGGKDYIDQNLDGLCKEIVADSDPKTALDVESVALQVLVRRSDTISFKDIKDYIFRHPVVDNIAIDLFSTINIMSVYLRDKYLAIHPEILQDGGELEPLN